MSRAAVALWLGVLVLGLTAIAAAYFRSHPPDYGFVDANRALLETLPVYPGAHFLDERSERNADPYAGFTTTRTFRLPAGSSPAGVAAFYERSLRARCVLVARAGSFRCGRARVAVSVRSGRYELAADAR